MASVFDNKRPLDIIRQFKFHQNNARKAGLKAGTECWPWQGSVIANGYGQFQWVDSEGKRRGSGAHRIALEIFLGRPLGDGMIAGHGCPGGPNRLCCNPAHLDEISQSQNTSQIAEDKIAALGGALPEKRVTIHRISSARNRSTEYIDSIMPEVAALRAQNWTWSDIAAKFNVSHTPIYQRWVDTYGHKSSDRRSTTEVYEIYKQIVEMRAKGLKWVTVSDALGISVHRCKQIEFQWRGGREPLKGGGG